MNIVYTLIGVGFLVTSAWAIISSLALWADNRRMNQKIKDGKGLHPNEVKNLSSLGGQLVLINVINVIAGATAGIGASLFVDGARLRWPSTGLAVGLIAIALAATEITGIFVIRYTTRPTRAWIYDTGIFRSYLARINASRLVSDEDIDDILETRAEWSSRTIVRPLRSRKELQELGLELMSAHQEWTSQKPIKPTEFGDKLLAETSRKQVWLWIRRKRLWRLGIPPVGSSFTLAALTLVVLVPYSHSKLLGVVLLTILFLFWGTVLFCMSYFTARRRTSS